MFTPTASMERPLTDKEQKKLFCYMKRHSREDTAGIAAKFAKIFKLSRITQAAINACIIEGISKRWDRKKHPPTKIYYCFSNTEVKVILPKKIGAGHLKHPAYNAAIREIVRNAQTSPERPLDIINVKENLGHLAFTIPKATVKSAKLRSRFANEIIRPIRQQHEFCFETEVSETAFNNRLKKAITRTA